jgi:hypothetical protein
MLEGNATHPTRALLAADSDWYSEPFLLVEFTNVMATAVRSGRIAASAAGSALSDAERVFGAATHAIARSGATSLA